MIPANDRAAAGLMAALLDSLRPITLLTPLALLAAGILVGRHPIWGWPLLLGLALLQLFSGWRLWLDAGYFRGIAQGDITLAELDEHLHASFGRVPSDPPRSLANRIAGTRALLRRHAILTLLCWLATLSLPLLSLLGV